MQYRQQNRCKIESPVHHLDTSDFLFLLLNKLIIALKKEFQKKKRPKSFRGLEFSSPTPKRIGLKDSKE